MNDLQEILDNIFLDIKNINNQLINKNIPINELEDILLSLDNYDNKIQQFNNTINIINNLKNNIKLIYNSKILNIKHNLKNSDKLNIKVENNYNYDYKIDLKNITNLEKFKNKNYAKCPVIEISEKQIPLIINSPIYYIQETKEYCIKINNKLIKGNIGNIFSETDKNQINIKKCNKIYCNNFHYTKKECNFYHENSDIRNFPNYSWKQVHKNKLGKIKLKKNNINYETYDLENTRFIGSLNSLSEDLIFTNKYEKELRNKQLMHDILIYQLLDQYLE
jgi:hypothetical protein